MRLLDLEPSWLQDDGARRWLLFKSPSGRGDWLTCKNFPMQLSEQLDTIFKIKPELGKRWNVVGCKAECCWTITGTLENLTVTPSIDASASGNWHGFITGGNVT